MVAKTSTVGMSDGKPKIILAAQECCLSNVLNNSVWLTPPQTGNTYVMDGWMTFTKSDLHTWLGRNLDFYRRLNLFAKLIKYKSYFMFPIIKSHYLGCYIWDLLPTFKSYFYFWGTANIQLLFSELHVGFHCQAFVRLGFYYHLQKAPQILPSVPPEQRRPIRVLSLFDGIATG